jgi:hypothetical protein
MYICHSKFIVIDLYGLSYECPYIIRKDICPLKGIDSLAFNEKVDWIDNLSEERKRSIWEQHRTCSQIRNGKSYSVL